MVYPQLTSVHLFIVSNFHFALDFEIPREFEHKVLFIFQQENISEVKRGNYQIQSLLQDRNVQKYLKNQGTGGAIHQKEEEGNEKLKEAGAAGGAQGNYMRWG